MKAVDGVSFAVTRGETFGVIGESGSGKSTLGRAVVCLLKPTAGRLKLDATDPYALSGAAFRRNRRDFQIVFQDPNAALNPRMRIRDSVREPLDILGEGTRAERDARAVAVLDRVGLRAEFGERYPHELSGGQKQRVNIARVLTLRPKLVVCDEVVAALDVSIQADMLNLFADLQREFGLTYLFITHDLGVVSHISDRIAVMYLGKFMELGGVRRHRRAAAASLHRGAAVGRADAAAVASAHRRAHRAAGRDPEPDLAALRLPLPHPLPASRRNSAPSSEPEWRELEPGRFVACHFAGQVTTKGRKQS